MDANAIGQTVRWARRRAGLTQQGLAEAVNVPQANIARIERGTVMPRTGKVVELLAATGHRLTVEPTPDIGLDHEGIRRRLAMSVPQRTRAALGRPAREARTGPYGILRRLRRFGVPFVLIGELAEVVHGSPARVRRTVEVCHDATDVAHERIAMAIADLEKETDAARLRQRLRLVTETDSGDGYELLARNASPMPVDAGISVRVAAIEDLIRIRRARKTRTDEAAAETLQVVVRELARAHR